MLSKKRNNHRLHISSSVKNVHSGYWWHISCIGWWCGSLTVCWWCTIHDIAASGILAPGMICCFPSRALRFFRCFNCWTCCLMVAKPPCIYSMSTLHNMQLVVPGISAFLIWSSNTIDSGPWVQLSFGNLEAGSGLNTLVSSHSHRHLFGMSFSISWSFLCSSLSFYDHFSRENNQGNDELKTNKRPSQCRSTFQERLGQKRN